MPTAMTIATQIVTYGTPPIESEPMAEKCAGNELAATSPPPMIEMSTPRILERGKGDDQPGHTGKGRYGAVTMPHTRPIPIPTRKTTGMGIPCTCPKRLDET